MRAAIARNGSHAMTPGRRANSSAALGDAGSTSPTVTSWRWVVKNMNSMRCTSAPWTKLPTISTATARLIPMADRLARPGCRSRWRSTIRPAGPSRRWMRSRSISVSR